jgi:cytochrome P450
MLSDPDLIPFEPPARLTFRALRRNFVEAFPRSTFEQGLTRIRGPFNDTLMICDPDLIHEMLVEKTDAVGRSTVTTRIFAPFLGDSSVFVTQGDDWHWKRRAVTSIFRHEALLACVPVFAAMAAQQVGRWRTAATDRPVDVAHAMRQTTFEIVISALLGRRADLDVEAYGQAITDAFEVVPWQTILAVFSAPAWVPFPGRRRLVRARHYVYGAVARVVAERRRTPAAQSDLLDILMAARDPAGRAMTDEEVVNNLITFISTGHEVSAQALAWTLWLLAKDPATQQRVRDEAHRVAGDQPIAPCDVEALAFTHQVVQEAMRLYPPAAILLRQARVDMTLGKHRVKAGTHIHIPIYALHRNARLWDHPNAFDPGRFAPDRIKLRPRYVYLPFGAGPRVCIGASFAMIEIVAILATLVRAFRFLPVPGHRPKPIARISLRVQGGMPLYVEPVA